MQNIIVGIDVSKLKIDICVIGLEKAKYLRYSNSIKGFKEFISWLERNSLSVTHVCMEATGAYSLSVSEFFHEQGYYVSVINPIRIKAFQRSQLLRNKNDKVDSLVIAEFCKLYQPTRWQPEDKDIKALKQLYRCLIGFKEERARLLNKLEKEPIQEIKEILKRVVLQRMELKEEVI